MTSSFQKLRAERDKYKTMLEQTRRGWLKAQHEVESIKSQRDSLQKEMLMDRYRFAQQMKEKDEEIERLMGLCESKDVHYKIVVLERNKAWDELKVKEQAPIGLEKLYRWEGLLYLLVFALAIAAIFIPIHSNPKPVQEAIVRFDVPVSSEERRKAGWETCVPESRLTECQSEWHSQRRELRQKDETIRLLKERIKERL